MRVVELSNGRKIGEGQPCFIVAEIGQNHQGDVYTATRLLKMAADAGVDAVKLCKRDLESDLTAAAAAAPYVGPQSFGPTYGEHRAALELLVGDYQHLKERVRFNEWEFSVFATACDRQSVDDLEEALDPLLYKIASRDLDNLPLLDYVARLKKPLILSTGMARPGEIEAALTTVLQHHEQIVLMYCISEYPCPDELVRLDAIGKYRDQYGVLIGFSDHTVGIHMAQAAVVLGAVVVEEHVTLARCMKGTDHAASLEAAGLCKLVRNIRAFEQAFRPGLPLEWLGAAEARKKLGRSLVSACEIPAGTVLRENHLVLKSPGTGLRWGDRGLVLGRKAARDVPADVTLRAWDFKTSGKAG